MQGLLNGMLTANTVMMLKSSNRNKTVLLVEGKTDTMGYGWLIDKLSCTISSGSSKDYVLEAITILENKRVSGILGIVDSDFWGLKGFVHPSRNILKTDTHDIETLVLNSPALNKVVHFYGDPEKSNKVNIESLLLNAAKPIGLLRLLSLEKGLHLNFKNLDFEQFVDKSTLQTNIQRLVKAVISNTKKCKVSEEQLNRFLQNHIQKSYSLWHICCGHDLVKILTIAFQEVVGSYLTPPTEKQVTKWLLIAYESIHLSNTSLYNSILNWEQNNKPFKVLSNTYRYVPAPITS